MLGVGPIALELAGGEVLLEDLIADVELGIFVNSFGGLHWVVNRTRMGTAMRALSFNATAASLVGINNDRVISFTFALGSALAAAGGILYAMNYPSIDPLMGKSMGSSWAMPAEDLL